MTKSIAAATHHTMFIRRDRSLWACGANDHGQLGNGEFTDALTPAEILRNVSRGISFPIHRGIRPTGHWKATSTQL